MTNLNPELLAKLLLDDDHGINSRAWTYLRLFLSVEIVSSVKCQDNRYYIDKLTHIGAYNHGKL